MTGQSSQSPLVDRVPDDCPGSREIGFSYPEYYNASAILFDNLGKGRSEKTAILSPLGNRTYGQLCAEAARYGNALLSLGLEAGDRVLMFLDDTPAYPAALFGAIRAGLVPVLINTLTPDDLLQYYLENSGARVAIADAAFVARFSATACTGTALEKLIVVNGEVGTAAVATETASTWLAGFDSDLDASNTHRDDMAFWMYSSGSTGRPKGIVHLQHDMSYSARAYADHVLKLGPDDICFSVPKIFFAYGFGNSINFPFHAGAACLLLAGQPNPAAIFGAIKEYRPTLFFGLPTLFTALVKAPEAAGSDLASLRLCLSAAEILSEEIFAAWKDMTGLEIVEGLGSTEILHMYLSNTAEAKKAGSAGRRLPGYEVVLRDAAGLEAGEGEEGILWVRGHSSSPGYWNQPDKTTETMRDGGWLYTGDRFRRDRDGHYYFLGRADDLVKVSGQWVYPLEVEGCLNEHPDVRECAVIAVALADRRTVLKAIVALNDGIIDSEATVKGLQTFVKDRLLPYKYPRIVEFVEDLPKTGTGKIDRQGLLNLPDRTD
jgi:benzoate-CoA ligase family protein